MKKKNLRLTFMFYVRFNYYWDTFLILNKEGIIMLKSEDEHFGMLNRMLDDRGDIIMTSSDNDDVEGDESARMLSDFIDPLASSRPTVQTTSYQVVTSTIEPPPSEEAVMNGGPKDEPDTISNTVQQSSQPTTEAQRIALQKEIRVTSIGLLETIVNNDILSEGEKTSLLTQIYFKCTELLKERYGIEL